ncbi:MAG: NADP-dependent oxidoreductase, partial [Alphaproteobacteria bacterium]
DAAGEIAELGEGVDGFAAGDAVFTYCRRETLHWGGYAEYLPMDARHVAPIPQTVSVMQAAAIPLAALTAWQALVDHARLERGQNVLIHAGAGGVGSFAIPIAKHCGATVLTTASAANADYVRSLGADIVIDYRAQDWVAAAKRHCPQGVDAVLECLGGQVPVQSLDVIRMGGVIVCLNEPVEEAAAAARGVRRHRLFVTPDGEDLREIARLIDAGTLPVPPIQVLPLAEAARAMELSKAGHIRGKLVLAVRESA